MSHLNAALTALILAAPSCLFGQAGTFDPAFNNGLPLQLAPGSIHDNIYEVVALPDTSILFCGTTYQNGATRAVVGHVLQDGTLDPAFGTNGYVRIQQGTSSFAYDMVVDAQGRIVVCGITGANNQYDVLIARLLPDGSYDTGFDGDGIVTYAPGPSDESAESVALDGTHIVIGGSIKPQAGFSFKHTLLARFKDDGSVDATFGTAGMTTFAPSTSTDQVNDIAVLADGSVVGAGYWVTNAMQERGLLVKVDPNGQPDAAFGTNGVKLAIVGAFGSEGMAVLPEGLEFVVAGSVDNVDSDLFLARFDATGSPVASFGTAGKTIVNNLVLDAGNDLARRASGGYVVAGSTAATMLTRDFWTVAFDANGMVDPGFGTNGRVVQSTSSSADNALAVDVQADGKIVVGGVGVFTNNDMIMVRYLDTAISTGTASNTAAEEIVVYPMPCTGSQLFVQLPGGTAGAALMLRDMRGGIVWKGTLNGQDRTTVLDVDALAAGMYMLELRTASSVQARSVVIVR